MKQIDMKDCKKLIKIILMIFLISGCDKNINKDYLFL